MRKRTSLAATAALGALLVSAPAAPAPPGPFELSLMVEPGGSYSDYEGFDFDLGYGLGLGWGFADDWSLELRGLRRESDSRFQSLELDTFQLGLRRAFDLASAWRPFVQAGAHYQTGEIESEVVCLDAGGQVTFPCPNRIESRDELGGFVGGGVDWLFSKRAALRFDGRYVVYESDATGDSEDTLDLTVGVAFRF